MGANPRPGELASDDNPITVIGAAPPDVAGPKEATTAPPLIEPIEGDESRKLIGSLLIDAGRITPKDVERIIDEQKRTGQRFGETGQALRLITREELNDALARQFDSPLVPPRSRPISSKVVAAYKPTGRVGEAMRALREQLMQRWFDGPEPHRALLMAGVQRQEGRSFITANLAVAFAQLGAKTLVVDADLRNPSQHVLFKLSNRHGLSNILAGRPRGDEVSSIPILPALSILPSGPLPPNPHELLARPRMAQLLAKLCDRFEVVLVDSPAASECADAQTLSRLISGTCLIARRDHTPIDRLGSLDDALRQVGTKVIGAVFNNY